MSLQKSTKISASAQLELRLEAFNVFNHRNYNNPAFGVDAGRAHVRGELRFRCTEYHRGGRSPISWGTMRQVQLGAKLIF
jgi:hypothetical protein